MRRAIIGVSRRMKDKIPEIIKGPLRSIVYSGVNSFLYRLFNIKNCYLCPICGYYGRFKNIKPETGERVNALCPRCCSLERHRLQYLAFKEVTKNLDIKKMSMLHFAPEDFLKNIFKNIFEIYVTADLYTADVDKKEDLAKLSIGDNAFDFIYASHVLEHIKDDISALSEIKRVLKQGGIAMIPVPIKGEYTIEYNEPNPHECGHIRSPGKDYYDRYKNFFTKIILYKSADFDEKYQLYVYENGKKCADTVPVCFK